MVKATFDLAQIDWTGLTMVTEVEDQVCLNKGLRVEKGPNVWKV